MEGLLLLIVALIFSVLAKLQRIVDEDSFEVPVFSVLSIVWSVMSIIAFLFEIFLK